MYTIRQARSPWGTLFLPDDYGTLQAWIDMNDGVKPVIETREAAEEIRVELTKALDGRYARRMDEIGEKAGTGWSKKPLGAGPYAYEIVDANDLEIAAWGKHVGRDLRAGRPREIETGYGSQRVA